MHGSPLDVTGSTLTCTQIVCTDPVLTICSACSVSGATEIESPPATHPVCVACGPRPALLLPEQSRPISCQRLPARSLANRRLRPCTIVVRFYHTRTGGQTESPCICLHLCNKTAQEGRFYASAISIAPNALNAGAGSRIRLDAGTPSWLLWCLQWNVRPVQRADR